MEKKKKEIRKIEAGKGDERVEWDVKRGSNICYILLKGGGGRK
jgi:hypothetical protein